MLKREDFTIDAVFNCLCAFPGDNTHILDENIFEYISERSLIRFFRRNGFFASAGELQAIIKRLDLNYDGVITKEELSRFLVNATKVEQSNNSMMKDHSDLVPSIKRRAIVEKTP